jgi:hypothetical protein
MDQLHLTPPPVLATLLSLNPDQVQSELAEVQRLRNQLETYETLLNLVSRLAQPPDGEAVRQLPSDPSPAMKPKTLREAILTIMADGRTWRPAEVFHRLNERGWAPAGSAARSQVSNRIRAMLKRGEIAQLDDGSYRLSIATRLERSEED